MTERVKKIAKPTAIVLAIGFTYFIIHELTGFALFCPFYRIFGLYCPGCGISRMFFHLSRFEFYEAFSSNCVVFCLLPIALFEAIFRAYRYIRYGSGKFNKAEEIGLWVVIAILIIFAVVRNLYPIDILVP